MDKNMILVKFHNRFPLFPQNALLTTYKAWSERIRLLMRKNIPTDICYSIKAKVRLAGKLPSKFITYMPDYGKGNYLRKQRARLVACHKCARMRCDKNSCSLGMCLITRKIRFKSLRMA